MKITEIRSDRIYRDMMTALPSEKEMRFPTKRKLFIEIN